jgi:hypothetical protein
MAVGESQSGGYDDVLLLIVERLIATVKGCNESSCYLSLDPNVVLSPADHSIAVSPVSGTFREGAFVGAGLNHLATQSGCIVKIHCPSALDEQSRDVQSITDESLGLIRKASAVIASLCNTGDGPGGGDAWAPRRGNYDLTSHFRPLNYSLDKSADGSVRGIELTFVFDFDWDVTRQ